VIEGGLPLSCNIFISHRYHRRERDGGDEKCAAIHIVVSCCFSQRKERQNGG
jgi:hypothetical protein